MMSKSHDELLEDAVAAQWRYEMLVEQAKKERSKAFRNAILGPVTGREIAKATGISESHVSRIARGER